MELPLARTTAEDLFPHPSPKGVSDYVSTWNDVINDAINHRDPLMMAEHPRQHVPTILWSALRDIERVEAQLVQDRQAINRQLITSHGAQTELNAFVSGYTLGRQDATAEYEGQLRQLADLRRLNDEICDHNEQLHDELHTRQQSASPVSLTDHTYIVSETHRIIGVLALLAQPSNVADVMIESMNQALIQRGLQHALMAVNRTLADSSIRPVSPTSGAVSHPPPGLPTRPVSPTSTATSVPPTSDIPKKT